MVTAERIQELGAILVVGAHPDDEVFIAAGLMAQAVQNDQRVGCVTATRGEQGIQDERRWPSAKLAAIRSRELGDSLAVLGVREHTWLGYLDGQCPDIELAEGARVVRDVINKFHPDTIITFGPDGLTGHPDHMTVSGWVREATKGTAARVLWAVVAREQYAQLREADSRANIFFNIANPPVVDAAKCTVDLRLDAELAELKRRSFEKVESQMERVLAARPFDRPGEGLARECFIEAKS